MDQELSDAVARAIARATGHVFRAGEPRAIGGGCINGAWVISDGGHSFFVKLNAPERAAMFEAEFAGLEELRRARSVRVPAPVCCGATRQASYLVMEYLEFGPAGASGHEVLGRQLAALHRVTRPEYGWVRDNTIGSTPQPNLLRKDWVSFWRGNRLGYQLGLAAGNGYGGRLQQRGERLLGVLPALLAGHAPAASLLHGDLWSGNVAFTRDGAPALFDPAVYYGDREADLAMTELFGGFPERFYRAYREDYPLDAGYAVRKVLYNLYHVLNHLNLFGGAYRAQAEDMIDALLSEAA